MQALMEITVWDQESQPNHMYWMDGTKAIAYSKWGKEEPFYFKSPMNLDKRGRKFVEVKDHKFVKVDKDPNVIEVAGSNGAVYNVNVVDKTCTCTGFKFRGSCKHVKDL